MLNVAVKAARAAGAIINRAALDVEVGAHLAKAGQRLRDRSGPCQRSRDHRNAAHGLSPPRHLGRGIGQDPRQRRAPTSCGSSIRWTARPTSSTAFPVYCVSIALAVKGKIEQAVIYDPSRNDLFTATKGRGAYMNERRIRVSKRIDLQAMPDLHRLPVPPGRQLQQLPAHDVRRHAAHRRPAPSRRRRARPGLCGRRLHRRLFRNRPVALGRRRRLAAGDRSRRPDRQLHAATPTSWNRRNASPAIPRSTASWWRSWASTASSPAPAKRPRCARPRPIWWPPKALPPRRWATPSPDGGVAVPLSELIQQDPWTATALVALLAVLGSLIARAAGRAVLVRATRDTKVLSAMLQATDRAGAARRAPARPAAGVAGGAGTICSSSALCAT